MNEHELQSLAVVALRKLGFVCCVSSNRKRTSNTKGMPDVFVNIKDGLWLALEFKQEKGGKIYKEQSALIEAKKSILVRSVEDAVEQCMAHKFLIK